MATHWIAVASDDSPNPTVDKHFDVDCPHCGTHSNLTAISTPRWGQIKRHKPLSVVIGYRCDKCNQGVGLRFKVFASGEIAVDLSSEFEELERPMETFDYQHLPAPVAADFKEALTCYSHSCLNAAAAMCRRTVQSASEALGASGTDKVMAQVIDITQAANVDEDTCEGLKQIILTGHDGAHPHLAPISARRAAVLIELMKDVLYQLFVRKAKVQEAMALRQVAIEDKKSGK